MRRLGHGGVQGCGVHGRNACVTVKAPDNRIHHVKYRNVRNGHRAA